MEIREFAERILLSPDLASKLCPPEGEWSDERPGIPQRVLLPARADHLRMHDGRGGAKMPKATAFGRSSERGIAHHIMANHELQALEVMAWTLLVFPDAPTEFRREVARIMVDEQRHTRMHLRRAQVHGLSFGSIPVNGHVWERARRCESLLDYLACLPLTFEGGNLDHTIQFARLFDDAGDTKGREVMLAIHEDEIDHVAFGLRWFRELKPAAMSDWDAYVSHLRWPMTPYSAKGKVFQESARTRAGMTAEFIDQLRSAKAVSRAKRLSVDGS